MHYHLTPTTFIFGCLSDEVHRSAVFVADPKRIDFCSCFRAIKDGPYAGNYTSTRMGIESILTNPAYIGWWISIEGEIVKDNHPAIIPEDLFGLFSTK